MGMNFPGMDPYLEDPVIWHGFHNRMIVYLSDQLRPVISPRYLAAVEERVFDGGPNRQIEPDVWIRRRQDASNAGKTSGATALLEADAPDVVEVEGLEVHESYVAILDRQTGMQVVVIEVVSPANKYSGPGRASYVAKQTEVLASAAHLVEIDLLRAGPHVLAVEEPVARRRGYYDYLTCVNRAKDPRNRFELYRSSLRERLPRIRIPLAGNDPDVALDVQAVVAKTYEAGDYRIRLPHLQPCRPPLSTQDQEWANSLIHAVQA